MPAWSGLGAALLYNYHRHRTGRSTICGVTRRVLPWPAVAAGWGVLTYVMLRHLRNGYPLH